MRAARGLRLLAAAAGALGHKDDIRGRVRRHDGLSACASRRRVVQRRPSRRPRRRCGGVGDKKRGDGGGHGGRQYGRRRGGLGLGAQRPRQYRRSQHQRASEAGAVRERSQLRAADVPCEQQRPRAEITPREARGGRGRGASNDDPARNPPRSARAASATAAEPKRHVESHSGEQAARRAVRRRTAPEGCMEEMLERGRGIAARGARARAGGASSSAGAPVRLWANKEK